MSKKPDWMTPEAVQDIKNTFYKFFMDNFTLEEMKQMNKDPELGRKMIIERIQKSGKLKKYQEVLRGKK